MTGMEQEHAKALVQRLHTEAESQGDLTVVDDLFAPSFVDRGHPERGRGPESVKEHIRRLRRRFPDLRVTINDLLADNDRVVVRVTSQGTQQEPFAGVAQTGRRLTWEGIIIRRFQEGRVVEQWSHFDSLGMLRQLGVLPDAVACGLPPSSPDRP